MANVSGTGPANAGSRRWSRLPALFVWLVWGVLALSLPVYVLGFSSSVPVVDDWDHVPALTRQGPHGLAWLWEPHNEHRILIPKLILLGLSALFGYDPRAGMFVSCAALAALSAVLILAVRRLRGTTRYRDAFFPLALLHWGQYVNLLYGVALNLVAAACLTGGLLIVVISARGRSCWRLALTAGPILLCLPLCGASGLVVVPAAATWFLWVGVTSLRSADPAARRGAGAVVAAAVLAFSLCGLYFVGDRELLSASVAHRAADVLRTAGQFVAMSVGPAGGYGLPFTALALVLVCAATLWRLRCVWRSRPDDRLRVAGLFSFFVSLFTLTFAVAWGRAPLGGVTTELAGTRFVTVAVPLLCWVYLAGIASRTEHWPAILCLLMALLLPFNTYFGYVAGRKQAAVLRVAAQDLRAGMSSVDLTAKWREALWSPDKKPEDMVDRWEMLRRGRQGP